MLREIFFLLECPFYLVIFMLTYCRESCKSAFKNQVNFFSKKKRKVIYSFYLMQNIRQNYIRYWQNRFKVEHTRYKKQEKNRKKNLLYFTFKVLVKVFTLGGRVQWIMLVLPFVILPFVILVPYVILPYALLAFLFIHTKHCKHVL